MGLGECGCRSRDRGQRHAPLDASVGSFVPSSVLGSGPALLGFGFKYQAVGFVNLVRDEGTNAVVAAVAGISALGLWSVAFRILQIPLLLLSSLWRVSFPGMSRLLAVDEDVAPTIERTLSTVAVVIGVILAPLAATSVPLVTVLLGDQWTDAAAVIPPASLNLMVAGSISVALNGICGPLATLQRCYGRRSRESVFLRHPVRVAARHRRCGSRSRVDSRWSARIGDPHPGGADAGPYIPIARPVAPPAASAVIAAIVGWAAASTVGAPLAALVIGAGVAWLVYFAALTAWHRRQLFDTVSLVSRGMRGAFATGH